MKELGTNMPVRRSSFEVLIDRNGTQVTFTSKGEGVPQPPNYSSVEFTEVEHLVKMYRHNNNTNEGKSLEERGETHFSSKIVDIEGVMLPKPKAGDTIETSDGDKYRITSADTYGGNKVIYDIICEE